MADSPRLLVLKALTAHLEGITVAAGYNYNLAGAVFRGRGRFGDNDPPTMVSILENPRPDYSDWAGGDQSTRKENWPLLLQGWCPEDSRNPSDPIYGLVWDVERRLAEITAISRGTGEPTFPAVFRLGNLITGLDFGPPVVRPPTDGVSSRAFFYMPVRVGLAVDL